MNLLLAALPRLTSDAMLNLLITVVIAGVVFWILFWLIDAVKLVEPFNKVAKVILTVAAVVWLLRLLIGLT